MGKACNIGRPGRRRKEEKLFDVFEEPVNASLCILTWGS
jgi:hypothetical protein